MEMLNEYHYVVQKLYLVEHIDLLWWLAKYKSWGKVDKGDNSTNKFNYSVYVVFIQWYFSDLINANDKTYFPINSMNLAFIIYCATPAHNRFK